jgi:hypothetical protein
VGVYAVLSIPHWCSRLLRSSGPVSKRRRCFDFAQNNQHGNGVQADMGRFWLLASTVLISVLPAAAADRTTKSTPIFG